jgi:hypothetical protein
MAERHFTPIPGVMLRRFQTEVQRYFVPMLSALAESTASESTQAQSQVQSKGGSSMARLGSVSRRRCNDAKSIIVELFELCDSAIFRATSLCLWGDAMFQNDRIET